jgi:hypothetical protein
MIITRYGKILGGIFILFIFLGLVIVNDAQAKYKSEASGSFTASIIDTNGDGIPGVTGILEDQSTFGSLTIHFFSEFDLANAAQSGNCPDEGYLEVPIVASNTIHRHKNGDLLLLETTGEFFWEETLAVIGGSGKFTDATGTLEASGRGIILISDQAGVASFGAMFMNNKGKIKLNGKNF